MTEFIYLFILFIWLHRVLVAARGIFVEAHRLFMAAHGLLSNCGVRVFFFSSCGVQAPGHVGSVVVVRGFQSVWAL